MVVDEATGWTSAQAPVSPVPITAYGTWVLHGLHLQVADFWVLEGGTWSYQGQNEWLFHESWTTAPVPPPVPYVSGMAPAAGPAGTLIAIAGDTFGPSQGTVTIHGLPAAVHSWTPTSITAVVPAGATTGPVQVISTLQQGSNTNHTFTVLPPAPPPEDVQYYHLDHLGSVRMITDSAGQLVARYDYTPFGQPYPGDLHAESRRFAQMERTPETGNQSSWEPLSYAGARYYHSQTGRFITPDDPIYGDPFAPQSMNLYAYALNNPLLHSDPTGTCVETDTNACVPGMIDWAQLALQQFALDSWLWLERQLAHAAAREEELIAAQRASWEQNVCSAMPNYERCASDFIPIGIPVAGTASAARGLGQALVKAGHNRPVASAAHHIVALRAKAADQARQVLQKFGISINSAVNGVFLPATKAAGGNSPAAIHSTLHTNAYYQAVNQMLEAATTRAEAVAALNVIRQLLLSGGL